MQIEAKKPNSNESGSFNDASFSTADSNQASLNENLRTAESTESTSSNGSSKKQLRQ
jgi:hypothetical protein